jgi:hypothetical protein
LLFYILQSQPTLDAFLAAIQQRYADAILLRNVANGRKAKISDYAEVRAAIEAFPCQDETARV